MYTRTPRGGVTDRSKPVTEEEREAFIAKKLAEQQAGPRRRAKRPGQAPPPRSNDRRQRNDVEDIMEFEDDEGPSSTTGSYAADVEKRHAAWQKQEPENTFKLQTYVALSSGFDRREALKEDCAAVKKRMQRAIRSHACALFHGELDDKNVLGDMQQDQQEEGQQQHQGHAANVRPPPSVCSVLSTRPVQCCTINGLFEVAVPLVACSVCSGPPWEVSAIDCGFFPSSTDRPEYWIDSTILQLYSLLAPTGLSMGSFADALAKLQQRNWWAEESGYECPPAVMDERWVTSSQLYPGHYASPQR